MEYTRKTKGICAKQMTINIQDGIVKQVKIKGGCDGNVSGIEALVKNMPAQEVINRLKGISCKLRGTFSGTSCPDQLAQTIEEALASVNQK